MATWTYERVRVLAETYDRQTHRQLSNLPLAFSHRSDQMAQNLTQAQGPVQRRAGDAKTGPA